MIKSSYESKVGQMKEFFHSNKGNVLNYNVTHGWLQPDRKIKVLEVYGKYVKVGVVNSRDQITYPECINYSSLMQNEDRIPELTYYLGDSVIDSCMV